jgi:hypothetical protein
MRLPGRVSNIPEEEDMDDSLASDEVAPGNFKTCECKARILVVDDTDFNVLAVKIMIKENFILDIE